MKAKRYYQPHNDPLYLNLDIRQLRSFTAIAATGTFTAAAARVCVTQAAISVQIRGLEQEVGVKLFIRTPRRVLLTEAGERLLEYARRILREHDAALAELAELAGSARGRLRIGSSSAMVTAETLPRILRALREQHAHAEVSVTSGTSEVLVRALRAGEIDLAFVSLPVEATGIETEVLSRDELVAIGHTNHPHARARVITAERLAAEPLILGERGGNTRRLLDMFFQAAGVRPEVRMELPRLQAIKRMVEEGLGLGIVPSQSAAEEVAAGRLVRWWIKGAHTINWELGLARLRDHDSPLMKAFARLSREQFKPLRKGERRKEKGEKSKAR